MRAEVAIVGAGYVGLPLGQAFAEAGVPAVLVDVDAGRLEVGKDFYLAYSPERVDPGRTDWTAKTTPKIVGGITPACTERALALYRRAVETVFAVSSPEAAELTK